MTEQVTQLTVDQLKSLEAIDLLDIAIDEVPETPDFINPPTGIYHVKFGMKLGTYDAKVYVDGKQVEGETKEEIKISANCEIVAVLDVAEKALDADEDAPRVGDMFSASYFGKRGVQDCVNDFKKIAAQIGAKTGKELLDAFSNGSKVEAVVAVQRTKRKGNDGTIYFGVKFVSAEVAG